VEDTDPIQVPDPDQEQDGDTTTTEAPDTTIGAALEEERPEAGRLALPTSEAVEATETQQEDEEAVVEPTVEASTAPLQEEAGRALQTPNTNLL